MPQVMEVRPSPIAGTWYAGNPTQLAKQVDTFLDQARLPELQGEVVALIAPHAGHRYSGRTAGYAYASVRGKSYDVVAIVSPLHEYMAATLLTTAHHAYQTPLGTIPVNSQDIAALNQALVEQYVPEMTEIAYDEEHSLEIQLPFLQRALAKKFDLLPVMVRSQNPVTAQVLGRALAKVLAGRKALLVASTDLSHFYNEEEANRLDAEMLHAISTDSPQNVFDAEFGGRGFACGVAAVAAVLAAASELGGTQVEVLHHSTSADETGDHRRVVGYGAAVVLRPGKPV